MKITILSPHRDDAAFSLSLAIDTWIGQAHEITVVCCFTRSAYAPFAPESILGEIDRVEVVSKLRAAEDLAWAAQYGSDLSLVDLGSDDAPRRLQCSDADVCGFPVDHDRSSIANIVIAVRASKPDALVLPLALGLHVDHVTTRDAALDGSAVGGIPIAFYEDLPYAARPGVADEIESRANGLALDLIPGFVQPPNEIEAALQRKLLISAGYRSQIDTAVAQQISRFCLQYRGRERLWANPRWQSSPLALINGAAPVLKQ